MNSFLSALRPYTTNKNTGNIYEIAVALDLLRKMGLTNDMIAENKSTVDAIVSMNSAKSDPIRDLFKEIQLKPVGSGLLFDGLQVSNIICATQDDSVGTGDFQLVTSSGIKTLSVCEGKVKRNGKIEKCLTNASARRFGCTEEDIGEFKKIEAEAVVSYKSWMSHAYGADESAWPARVRVPVANEACSRVASAVAARFGGLDASKQEEICKDILRIDGMSKPADYLVLVDVQHKTKSLSYFSFGEDLNDLPLHLVANSIYLEFHRGETCVGKTQVKFNNGVYHKGKTSSLCSSWNAVFTLNELFKMSAVRVDA